MIDVAAFTISWCPYAVFALIEQFGDPNIISPAMGVIPALIAKSSIWYNPIIYVGMNSQVRFVYVSGSVGDVYLMRFIVDFSLWLFSVSEQCFQKNVQDTENRRHIHNSGSNNELHSRNIISWKCDCFSQDKRRKRHACKLKFKSHAVFCPVISCVILSN